MTRKRILAVLVAGIVSPAALAYDCSTLVQWDAGVAYQAGEQVQELGSAYQANWWTQGQSPTVHSGEWQEWQTLGSCEASIPLPVIDITSPQAGASVTEGTTITLAAQASYVDGPIVEVQFRVNGSLLASVTQAPYQIEWLAVAGETEIVVTALVASGASQSERVAISVVSADQNLPPQVSLTSPDASASYQAGESVLFSASASDSDGAVNQVEFYLNDALVNTDSAAPYEHRWTAAVGNHRVYAKAVDELGAVTQSAAQSFTVSAAAAGGCGNAPVYSVGTTYNAGDVVQVDNQAYQCDVAGWCSSNASWAYAPGSGQYWQDAWTAQGLCAVGPDVSFTSPATGSVLLAGVDVTVAVAASDSDGSVTGVEFFANDRSIGQASRAPYETIWTPTQVGSVLLRAVAVDNEANSSSVELGVSVSDQPLVISLTSPASGDSIVLGKAVNLSAEASALTANVQAVEFIANGQVVATDSSAPYSVSWTPAAVGEYTVAAQATDSAGNSALSEAASVSVREVVGKRHKLIGYWHNFVNGAGCPMNLSEMSDAWDVIDIAFADNDRNSNGTVHFNLYSGDIHSDCPAIDPTKFKADIKALQAKGKVFVLSLGGAEGTITLNTDADQANFVASLSDIIAEWGFDGLDIDLESGSNLMHGTQIQARLPVALRQIQARMGRDMYLTMAPEHPYVQGAKVAYSGIWGAYIPVIDEVRDMLDLLHVQLYNNGGLDNPYTNGVAPEGSVDMMVASAKMLVEGFTKADGNQFAPLRDDQVAIGLPSGPSSANSGQAPIANIEAALDCLTQISRCDSVAPAMPYSNFGGIMTWSINWDQHDGFNFSGPVGAKLDSMNLR
ncbi:Ig-like domain-containing protein [Thaumasiovibrio sp. DFM-14]|uniref:Ig-like domain-containing protein n=1 Tax=Thaumasiovibrio sp. DFM-14 TaxID=3384792 RepID=UPI0039A35E79